MAYTVTVSNSANVARIAQITDGITTTPYKFLSLSGNVLDGTYHPIDSAGALQLGWWSDVISDATGSFATPPTIAISWTGAIPIAEVRFSGDNSRDEYPADFTIKLYSGATLLNSQAITGNTSVQFSYKYSTIYTADKVEIVIAKVNKASRNARIVELDLSQLVARADSIKTALLDSGAASATVTTNRTDTLLPKVVDATASLGSQFTGIDTQKPKIVETSSVTVVITSSDTLLLNTTDNTISASVSGQSTDTLLTTLTETSIENITEASVDSLLTQISESDLTNVSAFGIDSQRVALAEASALTRLLNSADTILFKLSDIANTTVSAFGVDSQKVAIVESDVTTTYVLRDDSIVVTLVEAVTTTNTVNSSDELVLETRFSSSMTDPEGFMYWIKSYETIETSIKELVYMTNVHTRMDEGYRQIHGKVEIVYTDPLMDNTITYYTSEPNSLTPIERVADNVVTPAYKWFSLHKSALDGTYHPMPGDTSMATGWWGTSLSNGSGVFAVAPVIRLSFSPRYFQSLKVIGDSKLDCYPVDFKITAFDNSNNVIHVENVVGNNLVSWKKDIAILNVAKLELQIYKINTPNAVAKIMEFYSAVTQTYDLDLINDLHLLEELMFESDTIPLGAVSSNEIDISLDNFDQRFTLENPDSPLRTLMKKNRKVTAWLGVEVIEGTMEWHQLGVFWTTNWKVPDRSLSAYVTARDRLELLRQTDYTTSPVFINQTVYTLFRELLLASGLNSTQFDIDTSLQDITVPYAWFERMNFKDALKRLASMVYVEVFCNREDKIIVRNVQDAASITYTFDDDTNLYGKDFPLSWAEITNKVNVGVAKWTSKTDQLAYNEEDFSIAPGETVERVYEFTSIPCLSMDTPVVVSGPDVVVTVVETYCWGTKLTFHNNGTTTQDVTDVTLNGVYLTQTGKAVVTVQDDLLILEEGEHKVDVNHAFIQTVEYAQLLGQQLLDTFKASTQNAVLDSRGNIALALGDRVNVNNRFGDVPTAYTVVRQTIDWDGSLAAQVEGRKVI